MPDDGYTVGTPHPAHRMQDMSTRERAATGCLRCGNGNPAVMRNRRESLKKRLQAHGLNSAAVAGALRAIDEILRWK